MNTTSTVTPISETPKQPQQRQTAKELIAANVKSLIEQLEAGQSDALTAYLNAMSRFHNYSFGNILEIARQRADATRVAGLYAWNQLGRRVMKGQKGIRILAPIVGFQAARRTRKPARTSPSQQQTRCLLASAIRLRLRCVADRRAQTFRRCARCQAMPERTASALWPSSRPGHRACLVREDRPRAWHELRRTIAILPGQSEAEEFSTLVHELAHEMLHKAERRTTTTKVVKETEAEAVAFVVGKAVGLETGSASADYIQLYHGNASLLGGELGSRAADLRRHSCRAGAAVEDNASTTDEAEAIPDAELAKVA